MRKAIVVAMATGLMVSACASRGDAPAASPTAQAAPAPTGSLVDRAPIRALTPEQNLARSQAFLAQNASNPGVQVTPSGLQYRYDRVMPETGQRPTAADRVRVHYEGRLIDGQVFDSSFARGEPAEFPLGGVIAAWTEAVQLMRPGETITLWAPPELAYGTRGAGGGEIPPNSALIFRVELLGFTRADGTVVTP